MAAEKQWQMKRNLKKQNYHFTDGKKGFIAFLCEPSNRLKLLFDINLKTYFVPLLR